MIDCAYYNGVITPYDSAVIPLSDRSVFFAESVYDVMIGRNGIPYQLSEHLSRLTENANAIGLHNLPSTDEIYEAIDITLEESQADSFVLYVQLSGDAKRRSHSRCDSKANLLITATCNEAPEKLDFCRAISLPDQRYGYCNLKTTNLLPAVLSIADAESQGTDVAIFQKNGMVTEASHANVSIIRDGALFTHPKDNSVLPGISELNLIKACKELGMRHIRQAFSIDELTDADLVMLTSTTKLIKICSELDGKALKCKDVCAATEIFRRMRADFLKNTEAKC